MKDIYDEVAEELDIDSKLVEKVVGGYLWYVRKRISKKNYKTLEDFDGVRTNIPLPGLGKLIVSTKTKREWKNRNHQE